MSRFEISFVQLPGAAGAVCSECGALVHNSAHWISVHESWHWRVSDVMRSVEAASAAMADRVHSETFEQWAVWENPRGRPNVWAAPPECLPGSCECHDERWARLRASELRADGAEAVVRRRWRIEITTDWVEVPEPPSVGDGTCCDRPNVVWEHSRDPKDSFRCHNCRGVISKPRRVVRDGG